MNHTDSQAELLEQYINELSVDVDALPPAGMDIETALFARTLVATRRQDRPDLSTKERIWNRVLFTMHFIPEASENPPNIVIPELTYWHPQPVPEAHSARTSHKQWAIMLVAAVFVVVFFSTLLIYEAAPRLIRTDRPANFASQSTVIQPQDVNLDPGDSLLLRTVRLFEVSAVTNGGLGADDMTGRLNFAD